MKRNLLHLFVATLIGSALMLRAADEPQVTLKAGDAAPALKSSGWVKGNPVESFKPGTVYVVEFWATWCGPCRTTIPHLTDLAKKYKGKVEFIGMDVWERAKTPAEIKEKVESFVKEMGAKMDYNVALDTEDTHMATAWMKAAGRNGIPSAFVVDKAGRIAWIGHPMDGMEEVIDQVLEGKFDAKAAAQAQAKKQAEATAAQKKEQELARTISRLRTEGKAAEALAEFDRAAKENPAFAKRGAMMRISLQMEADRPAALKSITELREGEYKNQPRALMSLARMVGGPTTKNPDHALAVSLAEQAAKGSKEPDAMISMGLSDVYNASGDKAKAITAMKECIAIVEKDKQYPPTFITTLKDRLEKLESGKQATPK